MIGVRFREDTGFEGRCELCTDYWPLTLEFWYPRWGLARCRACVKELRRSLQASRYERSQEAREYARESQSLYRWKNRAEVRRAHRTYYQRNRERLLEQRRAWYQKNRERILAELRVKRRAAVEQQEAAA